MKAAHYILGSDEVETARLHTQAHLMDKTSKAFVNHFVKAGDTVLEIGCGTGNASMLVLDQLEHTGHLTIIEREANFVEFTRSRLAINGYNNATVIEGTLESTDLSEQFDVIYVRLVLHHIPEAKAAIKKLLSHLKPGGLIAFEEPIVGTMYSIPESPEYTQIGHLYNQLGIKLGTDFEIGLKLPGYLKKHNLEILKQQHVQQALLSAEERNLIPAFLQLMQEKLIQHGITNQTELDNINAAVSQLQQSDAEMYYVRYAQVLAKKS